MKAFFATAYGGPEVMKLGELPDPVPRAGEVVVAVRAAEAFAAQEAGGTVGKVVIRVG